MESQFFKRILEWNAVQTVQQPLGILSGSELYQYAKLTDTGAWQWIAGDTNSMTFPCLIFSTRSIRNTVREGITLYNMDIIYLELTDTDFANYKTSQERGWKLILSLVEWFEKKGCGIKFTGDIEFVPVEPNRQFQYLTGVGSIATIKNEGVLDFCC